MVTVFAAPKERRPCIISDKETGEMLKGMFHLWTLSPDGWPLGLVELEHGGLDLFGYRKIIFVDHSEFKEYYFGDLDRKERKEE